MKTRFDIIVVGGGLVGSAFALSAANRGFEVLVLDRDQPPQAGEPLGLRVSALSSASQALLESIDAWRRIPATHCHPYTRMQVWDAGSDPDGVEALRFAASDLGRADLGHIVCDRAARAAVFAAGQGSKRLDWLHGAAISELSLETRRAVVATGDRRFSAALVVAADGARSWCREHLQIPVRRGDYRQNAVVAHLESERGNGDTAWQRFLPTGPLALLPLDNDRSSLVWSTSPDEAQQLLELDEQAFCARVTEASGGVIGRVTGTSPRAAFPLRWLHAREYTRPRFALAGDAAHAVHPLAGQGVNLGLLDAATLCDVIAAGRDAGEAWESQRVLRRYARWRIAENGAMVESFGALNTLFSEARPVAGHARRLGLAAVNRLPGLKTRFMRHALGIGGDLPPSLSPPRSASQ